MRWCLSYTHCIFRCDTGKVPLPCRSRKKQVFESMWFSCISLSSFSLLVSIREVSAKLEKHSGKSKITYYSPFISQPRNLDPLVRIYILKKYTAICSKTNILLLTLAHSARCECPYSSRAFKNSPTLWITCPEEEGIVTLLKQDFTAVIKIESYCKIIFKTINGYFKHQLFVIFFSYMFYMKV